MSRQEQHEAVDALYRARIEALTGSEDAQVYFRLLEQWRWAHELIESE